MIAALMLYLSSRTPDSSSSLALEVYARKMERTRDTGERMDTLIRSADWAPTGTSWILLSMP